MNQLGELNMNQITEKLTTPNPKASLEIAHEHTVNALQSLYSLAERLMHEDMNQQAVSQQIVRSANALSVGCRHIYLALQGEKNEALKTANELAEAWRNVSLSTVKTMQAITEKLGEKNND